jgi:hypothetical protein
MEKQLGVMANRINKINIEIGYSPTRTYFIHVVGQKRTSKFIILE